MLRRGALVVGLAAPLLLSSGCARKLRALQEDGAHAEVIERVRRARREPRGERARIYASALEAVGQLDEARAALQWSWRHGGDVRSLVALADLELRHGLDGVAAAHYARVISLEPAQLEDRQDVCLLLRRRAAALASLDEGLAADRDLRRARLLCGAPRDAVAMADENRLLARVQPMAEAQARAMRALPRCEQASCEDSQPPAGPEGAATLRAALLAAEARGASALREEAARRQASLEPPLVASLLEAELAGRLGVGMMDDAELRARAGPAAWSELSTACEGLAPGPREYALLRLSYIREPDEDLAAARARWLRDGLRAVAASGPVPVRRGWRFLARTGDMGGAELELGAGLRRLAAPTPAPEGAPAAKASVAEAGPGAMAPGQLTPAPRPHQDQVPAPDHWSGRVPVGEDTFVDLLDLARMRAAKGRRRLALELERWVFAEGLAAGLPRAAPQLEEEVARRMALGRVWEALALAELSEPLEVVVRPAAATALRLELELCSPDCAAEDRALVEAALGAAWAEATAGRLASDRTLPTTTADATWPGACPGVAELMSGEERGLVAGPSPATGWLVDAIERDLTLGCRGRWAASRLLEPPHRVGAAALSERLAHTPELDAGSAQLTLGLIALAGGDDRRAALYLRAAAASAARPERVWVEAALVAADVGATDLQLEALRQALLHSVDLVDLGLRRALLLARFDELERGHFAREGDPVALEALERQLEEHLARLPASRRWAELEWLASATAELELDGSTRARLDSLLWARQPGIDHVQASELISRRGGEALVANPDLQLDPVRAEWRGGGEAVLEAVLGARALRDRARARAEGEGSGATEAAVSVLAIGPAVDRARTAQRLWRAREEPEARRRLEDLLVRSAVAWSPGVIGETDGPPNSPVLLGDEVRARVLAGRSLDMWARIASSGAG